MTERKINANKKQNMIPEILELADKGLKVFPTVNSNKKSPIIKGWEENASNDHTKIINWWNDNRDSNIGVPAGVNGLFVIDVDNKPNSTENGFKSLNDFNIKLPNTLTQNTPNNGTHYIYKMDNLNLKGTIGIIPGVDTRGFGSYFLIAPSSIDGKSYRLSDTFDYNKITSIVQDGVLNSEIAKLLSFRDQKLFNDTFIRFELPKNITTGTRNDMLFKYACSLQAKGYSDDYIITEVNKANDTLCDDPLDNKELDRSIKSALRYPKGTRVKNNFDLGKFHKFNSKGMPIKVLDMPICDYIKSSNNFFTIGGGIHLYNNGCYSTTVISDRSNKLISSEQYLHGKIRNITYDSCMDFNIRERLMKLLMSDTNISDKLISGYINRYKDSVINFKNGMYDVTTGKLMDHDVGYNSINQIPHDINVDLVGKVKLEDAKVFNAFLQSTFNDEENIEMFLQYLALSLTKYSPQQALYIVGVAGSGKSLLLNFIRKIIGNDNIANITVQSLGERFTNYLLFGKQLNIYADLPTNALEKGDYFKTIFGNDSITVEQKFKDAFSFTPYVKGIFSMNRIPSYIDEKSDGYYRRLLIIRIKNKGQFIDDIENRLAAEIPIIIPLLIQKLKKIIDNRWTVEESQASEREKYLLKTDTDPVSAFIEECVDFVESQKYSLDNDTERYKMYEYYVEYCQHNRRKYTSKNKFYAEMRERGFEEKKSHGLRYFKGLIIIPFEGMEIWVENKFFD